MGRKPRIWNPGVAYHVIGRGNQRANLFKDDLDYEVFLSIMNRANEKTPYQLYAYCLMPNHYHLLLSHRRSSLIAAFMLQFGCKGLEWW